MQLSWKVILAPIFGAAFGWLAAHGIDLNPAQQGTLTTWLVSGFATLATWAGHYWHEKTQADETLLPPPTTKQGGFVTLRLLFPLLVLVVMLATVLLSGCASLGLTAPQSPQQSIAYAYSGVNAALTTLAQATTAGLISSADATTTNQAILTVKGLLDQANAILSSNQSQALTLLTTATKDLTAVSAYLACKQAKETTCQLSLS
jgi:uncharacterized protein YceK